MILDGESSHGSNRSAEAGEGDGKENSANDRQRNKLLPDNFYPPAAKQDALGQYDEVGRRRRQHDLLDEHGHALPRRHATGEHLEGQHDQDHQQGELRHGAGEGGQKYFQRCGRDNVQRRAAEE